MAELISQFEEALENIEPSDDDKANASEAHQEVRDALSKDPVLKEWGIETILIGSYKRHVSIRRVKNLASVGLQRNASPLMNSPIRAGHSGWSVGESPNSAMTTPYPWRVVLYPPQKSSGCLPLEAKNSFELSKYDYRAAGAVRCGPVRSSVPWRDALSRCQVHPIRVKESSA